MKSRGSINSQFNTVHGSLRDPLGHRLCHRHRFSHLGISASRGPPLCKFDGRPRLFLAAATVIGTFASAPLVRHFGFGIIPVMAVVGIGCAIVLGLRLS